MKCSIIEEYDYFLDLFEKSAVMDPRDLICQAMGKLVNNKLKCEGGAVYAILNGELYSMYNHNWFGYSELFNADFSEMINECVQTAKIKNTFLLKSNPDLYLHSSIEMSNEYKSHELIIIPTIFEKKVVGVMNLIGIYDANVNRSSLMDQYGEFLKKFSSCLAQVLENIQITKELRKKKEQNLLRLAYAAESRDNETGKHLKRMKFYTQSLAEFCGLDVKERDILSKGSILHDLGKIGILDSVLLKPGKLNNEEWNIMKQHVLIGAQILEGKSESEETEKNAYFIHAVKIARSHHEKWDGTGYPDKLKGEDIPLEARITAVADVFDALTSDRPYKKAWTLQDAKEEIVRGSNNHFDPLVVCAFEKAWKEKRIQKIHDQYHD